MSRAQIITGIISNINNILPQIKLWDSKLVGMNMTYSKYAISHSVRLALIRCLDYNHPLIVSDIPDNEKELFSLYYLTQVLQECDFDKYIRLIRQKFPDANLDVISHVFDILKKTREIGSKIKKA